MCEVFSEQQRILYIVEFNQINHHVNISSVSIYATLDLYSSSVRVVYTHINTAR